MNKTHEQRGFSSILLLLIVLVVAGMGVYIYMMKSGVDYSALDSLDEVKELVVPQEPDAFEKLEEPTGTPEVINNDAMDELDALMNDIESTSEGEDFTDLSL